MRIDIREKVDAKEMNRNQFSKAMSISYQAACDLYEGKTSRIDFNTLESLCRVLECTPNDFIISDDPQVSRLLEYEHQIRKLHESKGDTE